MKGFDKIIESLEVAFIRAKHIEMLQPLSTKTFYDIENTLLLVNRGQLTYTQGETQQKIAAGDMLFIPGGKATTLTYGTADLGSVSKEHFTHLQFLQSPTFEADFYNYSYITFDAKVFNAVNLFAILDLPPFTIENNSRLRDNLKGILIKSSTDQVGSDRVVKANTERLLSRYFGIY